MWVRASNTLSNGGSALRRWRTSRAAAGRARHGHHPIDQAGDERRQFVRHRGLVGGDPPDRPAGKAAPDRAQERKLQQASRRAPRGPPGRRWGAPFALVDVVCRSSATSIGTKRNRRQHLSPLTLPGNQERGPGADMKFGVFDHIDDAGVPLAQLYADRLRIAEAYDRAGFYGYHVAEHHSTPLGAAASPGADHGGAGLPHQQAAVRPAGLSAAVLPSAAADRGGLHARPDERRALPARRRPRRVDVRDRRPTASTSARPRRCTTRRSRCCSRGSPRTS